MIKTFTRAEVQAWPPLGPMVVDRARLLATIEERDEALVALEQAIAASGSCHCGACENAHAVLAKAKAAR